MEESYSEADPKWLAEAFEWALVVRTWPIHTIPPKWCSRWRAKEQFPIVKIRVIRLCFPEHGRTNLPSLSLSLRIISGLITFVILRVRCLITKKVRDLTQLLANLGGLFLVTALTNQTANNNNDEGTNERTNRRRNEGTKERRNEPTNERTNEPTNQPTNQPTDRPTNQSWAPFYLTYSPPRASLRIAALDLRIRANTILAVPYTPDIRSLPIYTWLRRELAAFSPRECVKRLGNRQRQRRRIVEGWWEGGRERWRAEKDKEIGGNW